MKILITGAAGFIGSRLAEALLGHGHQVVGIHNLSTGNMANFPSEGHLVIGDIRDIGGFPSLSDLVGMSSTTALPATRTGASGSVTLRRMF